MKFRRLGHSGLEVSTLCLGTMLFGDQTPEAEAERIVRHAGEIGVNFLDTADAYAGGDSERMIGRLIKGERDRWLIATKVGTRLAPPDRNRGGLGRRWIMRAIEDSLTRLGLDHVDIYYLHLDDPAAPIEETVVAMGELVRQGKARYWGVSNIRGWKIAEMMRLCDVAGVARPIVGQPYYNAMNRLPEVEYLPVCAHYRMGVVPYSPLARGVLTGKYTFGQEPEPGTRAGRKDKRMMETEFRRESMAIAQTIKAHAEARGRTTVGFAVNWVLANPIVSSVIAGPRTMAQWMGYVQAIEEGFDAEDEALLDSLVASGHPSTPGYNDPVHVITGRPKSV